MVSVLSSPEHPGGEELRVGCRDGWCLWATAEGLFIRPQEKDGLLGRSPTRSARIATQLAALAEKGFCRKEESSYYFSYSDLQLARCW